MPTLYSFSNYLHITLLISSDCYGDYLVSAEYKDEKHSPENWSPFDWLHQNLLIEGNWQKYLFNKCNEFHCTCQFVYPFKAVFYYSFLEIACTKKDLFSISCKDLLLLNQHFKRFWTQDKCCWWEIDEETSPESHTFNCEGDQNSISKAHTIAAKQPKY